MKQRTWLTGLVAAGLSLALLLGAAACGGRDGTNPAATQLTGDSTGGDTSTGPDAGGEAHEQATITIYNFGDPNDQWKVVQDKVNEYLNEQKTNLQMDLRFIPWTDYQNKYALMLTGGDNWDLAYTSATWLHLFQNIEKGAFKGFTPDEVKAAMPKTYDEIGEENWKAGSVKGTIYAIPTPLYTHFVNHGFYYRGDWAIEAGIPDGKIESWSGENSMTTYMEWIKDNKDGVIPWDVSNGYRATFEIWMTTHTDMLEMGVGASPATWSIKSKDDLTVVNAFELEEFEKMATLMKEWNDKGFWRVDALNNTNDTRDALKAGTNGVDQHHLDTYRGLVRDMDKQQPDSDLRMYGTWVNRKNAVAPPVVHDAVSVSNSSKHPMRALHFYELAMQDETLNRYLQYGIKDQHYFLNEEGQTYRPDDFDPAKDGYDGSFWSFRNDRFIYPTADDNEKYLKLFEELKGIKFNLPFDGFPFDPTPVQTQIANTDQVITTQLAAICYGMVDDVTAAVEKFRSDLKAAGADQITEEIQKQLDEYMASRG